MIETGGIEVQAQVSGPFAVLHIECEPFDLRHILDAIARSDYANVAEAARRELGWST